MSTPDRPSRANAVLSVNAGSSSLKFALYPGEGTAASAAILSGQVEGLEPGGQAVVVVKRSGQERTTHALTLRAGESRFDAALNAVIGEIDREGDIHLRAVAHRIVHGGERFSKSVAIDDEVLAYLESIAPLAPLHQPHNLAGVRAFQRACPGLPQVACFDTAFHAAVPEVERRFALPETFHMQGIRRYGFHGLSYQYVTDALTSRTPRATRRMLLAHLGNGASLCAVRSGRSLATTMGFSALDGLMMGTRCGSLDPGVLLHWLRQGVDALTIEKLLYRQSGLLGVSGVSADMRTLRASAAAGATRAIELFTYRIVRECGALSACLGGIDLIGFTGGIGEHDTNLRADVCAALSYLGVRVDPVANDAADGSMVVPIHAPESAVEVWVVPTDEGHVAAREALMLTVGSRRGDVRPS